MSITYYTRLTDRIGDFLNAPILTQLLPPHLTVNSLQIRMPIMKLPLPPTSIPALIGLNGQRVDDIRKSSRASIRLEKFPRAVQLLKAIVNL